MRLLVFALSLLMSNPLFAQNWSNLSLPIAGRYDDVFFLTDSTGWTCNAAGQIYRTDDGGQSWSLQIDGTNYLRSIEFADENIGFCGGLDSGEYFFKTENGGTDWANITDEVPGLSGGICGLSCPGGGFVYGCGQWSGPAYIIKSSDNGSTWQNINMSAYASKLVDIHFTHPDTGWVSGTALGNVGGIMLQTTDGGNTWSVKHQTNKAYDYIWKLFRLDSQNWFASIEREPVAQSKTEILKSNDGGQTWMPVLVKSTYHRLQMVGFLTPQHGWTGDFSLFETTDGGMSWQQVNSQIPDGGSFNRFWRFDEHHAIVTGSQLYRYNSTMTSVPDNPSDTIFIDFHSLKILPNPNDGQMEIAVDLKQKTQVILKMYALNGGFEQIVWTGEHLAGEYKFPVKIENARSGTYVVWLKTNHGTQYAFATVSVRH